MGFYIIANNTANDIANKSNPIKPYTVQDVKKRIEEEKKRDPEAFKKKYSSKMPRVQKK